VNGWENDMEPPDYLSSSTAPPQNDAEPPSTTLPPQNDLEPPTMNGWENDMEPPSSWGPDDWI